MSSRKFSSVGVVLCLVTVWGCDGSTQANSAESSAANLSGHAPHCTATDTIDSMPDGVDEDCDGVVDEDVEFSKKQCPPGSNVILGTKGNDTLNGTNGRDCILGFGGNDTINGGNGDDFISGGPGDDHINAGNGHDTVFGGTGNDYIDAAGGGDAIVYGGDGADTMLGGNGLDAMYGGDGNDVMMGGNGADIIQGGGCNDLVIGEKGPDVAIGGKGFDACGAELSLECEKSESNKVDCHSNSDCGAGKKCAQNVGFCVPNDVDACGTGCIATASTDTTCDGVDDDCDGQKDEDFVASMTACGTGACHASGATSCVNGSVVNSCHAGMPASDDASCDGIDNNCNGLVDEGYVSLMTSCGIGACASTGATACVSGHVTSSCTAGLPAASDTTCNGIDDNCNGSVDEGYVSVSTSCGVGQCHSTGTTSCSGGAVLDTCSPTSPAANDNTCDGIDNNCNGSVDEGYVSVVTHCGSGACSATGASSCHAGGVLSDSCTVTCEGACGDMLDDDHDGQVDCADSDCAADSNCAPTTNPYIGQPCTDDSACGPGGFCETALPGGYCYVPCDTSKPVGNQCPGGATCWLGSACVVSCGAGNSCSDPRLSCGDFTSAGLPPEPFCHPTCMESCVNGATCDPSTNLCF